MSAKSAVWVGDRRILAQGTEWVTRNGFLDSHREVLGVMHEVPDREARGA